MEEREEDLQLETADVAAKSPLADAVEPPTSPTGPTPQPDKSKSRLESTAVLFLLLILIVGAYFRFTGQNWDGTYHLHPDERFLTDTAGLLHTTDPITYLKTSESPLNPYNVGKSFYVYGNFPMTFTRIVAEAVDGVCQNMEDLCQYRYVAYDGIHLVGRFLSALVDLVSIVFIFLIGRRLYDWRVGLIAALLMALAVLPIQQSHFFTMDNWAAALTTMAVYAAVRAAEDGLKAHWWAFFGVALGLAVASRINVAPLAGLAVLAAIVWLARRAEKHPGGQSWRYILTNQGTFDLQWALAGIVLAALLSAVTFRLAQPYAFADRATLCQGHLTELGLLNNLDDACLSLEAQTGEGLSLFERTFGSIIGLNPQFRANMNEIQGLQSPDASFPPALQWTDRAPILFPLTNMFWGMGLTAFLAGWLGFLWALWRIVRARPDWTAHALPVVWVGVYFLFMATRWVKSIRYFLPIYPFMFLLAGWALIELWKRASQSEHQQSFKRVFAAGLAVLVIVPTFLWANAFLDIYREPVTRIQAAAWMFDNVRSGATLLYEVEGESRELQLPLRRYDFFGQDSAPLFLNFNVPEAGTATAVRFNYLLDPDADLTAEDSEALQVTLMNNSTNETLSQLEQTLNLGSEREAVLFDLDDVPLDPEKNYTILATPGEGGSISAQTSFLMNEHWDDSLPVRYDGRDPYFAYYDATAGGPVAITHPDSTDKLESFYMWLEQSDYIVLSSQRSIWSTPRLPLTYPLTTRYYDALFNGELGFELANEFHADLHIGPLYISDTGGEFSWGQPPEIGWPPPGDLAVEEAFSVYDHPPVWLFRKTADYNPERVRQVLGDVNLNQVITMTPGQATQAPNGLMLSDAELAVQQTNGTFSTIFDVDGPLATSPALAAVVWWLAVILLGWLVFPLTFTVLRGLPDRGYPLARILSLLLISYFGWLVASLKLLAHTRNTLILGLILIGAVSLTSAWFRRQSLIAFVRRNLALIGFVELFALALYLIFIFIRLGNPDLWDVIWGGEKPMDLSYFNAVLKSTVFPPYDPWFAGGYINYYYYGFVYVGSLTKLLGIVPNIAYNLILPMLFSFTGLGVFSVAYNLVAWKKTKNWTEAQSITNIRLPITRLPLNRKAVAAGVIAAVLCIFLGNLAEVPLIANTWYRAGAITRENLEPGPIDVIVDTARGAANLAFTDANAPIYPGDWFWSATRVINIKPGETQPITEFPFFTFLYGDLHAHMISLPLTIFALAWAVSMALQGKRRRGSKWSTAVTTLQFLIGGLAIGSLQATNTWDFPTYLFIGLLAVVFNAYRQHEKISGQMLGQALVQAVALAIIALVSFLPFTENYGVGYSSFSLWPGSYTHFNIYLTIYGLFLFFVFTHLARELRAWTRTWTREGLAKWEPYAFAIIIFAVGYVVLIALLFIKDYWIAPFVLTLVIISGLLGLRPNLSPKRRIPLILISSALGLTMMVELIVLDGDIGRMNTVFKFYMQVWVMLSIVGGVAAAMAWPAVQARRKRLSGRVWTYGLALLLISAVLYPLLATKAKWDTRMSADAPTTLDGMAFLEVTEYQDIDYTGQGQTIPLKFDYEALLWMREFIPGSPVIAEAHAVNPYRAIGNRVAMFTGLPSIVGWDWHQRQQRAVVPSSLITSRVSDVNALYSTTNTAEALSIIDKYNVQYIYVGQLEWVYYIPQGLNKFDNMADQGLLEEVYRNAGVSIYKVLNTHVVTEVSPITTGQAGE